LQQEVKDGIKNFCVFRFGSDGSLLLLFREGLRIICNFQEYFFCNKKAKLNPDVVWDGGLALSLKRIFNYKLDYGFIASRFMISP
jgi:hypothetical protein